MIEYCVYREGYILDMVKCVKLNVMPDGTAVFFGYGDEICAVYQKYLKIQRRS